MKRFVLLIIMVLVLLILHNYWRSFTTQLRTVELERQLDSLTNVVSFYESNQRILKNNVIESTNIGHDSLKTEIKARDSALYGHDQQIRWLQWHVERLNKHIIN